MGPTQGYGATDKGMKVIIFTILVAITQWVMATRFYSAIGPQLGTHQRVRNCSPGSTQPLVNTIRTCLGGPSPQSFPKEINHGVNILRIG